ncbi:MAG: polysaccharide lyase [Tangfeifania sp.]
MIANKFITTVFKVSLIIFTLDVFAVAGDTATMEENLASREAVIFFGGFEEGFNNDLWKSRWGIPWMNRAAENKVIENGFQGGKLLRVKYPEGGVGPLETGGQFPMVFRNMEGIEEGLYQELYLRYYLKFEKGFDFNKGGKLPGLMGGGDSWDRSGGNSADWTPRKDSHARFDGFAAAKKRVGEFNE